MKILNRTDWSGKDLQSIFRQCLRERAYAPRAKGTDLIVEVVNARGLHVSGYAYYGKIMNWDDSYGFHYHIRMRIPKVKNITRQFFVCRKTFSDLTMSLAQIFLHESDHAFAKLKHADMLPCNKQDISFLIGIVMPKKSPPVI